MNDITRPLPNFDEPDTKPFWDGTKQRNLKYQQCADCQTVVFHPRRHCTGCLGSNLVWQVASGRARVYSYSIVRQSYHPFFRNHIPYVVAWIDLEEGPRLLSNIVGVDAEEVFCDMEVEVDWEANGDYAIPLFKPIS